MSIIKKLKFSRKALLFDTHLFLVKIFFSAATGYLLFSHNELVGKDMISLMFGMIVTLQPVNYTGVKGGFLQIKDSVIGGVITAVIISVFGINFVTVALAIAITGYIALKMNWREMSIIAVFTAIYMTNYIQLDGMGMPSMWLTLRLRIISLSIGVLIAIFYNFIFSVITYKRFIRKRTIYLIECLLDEIDAFANEVNSTDEEFLMSIDRRLGALFSDFNEILSHFNDVKFESEKEHIKYYTAIVKNLRDLNHHLADVIMHQRVKPLAARNELDIISDYLKSLCDCVEKDCELKPFEAPEAAQLVNMINTIKAISILKK